MDKPENTSKANNTEDALDSATTRRILKETAENISSPSPALFARIEQSLDKATDTDSKKKYAPSRLQSLVDRLHNYFNRPGLAWGVVAIQAIVLCLFLAFSPVRPSYRTLSVDRNTMQTAATQIFYVIFNDNATIQEIENLLVRLDAAIINGPGKRGIYTIKFLQEPSSSNTDNNIQSLRKSSLITFIEKAY